MKTHWEEIINLPSIIKVNSQVFKDKTAIQNVSGVLYSYAEMDRSVRFIASMIHSTGIGKGQKVAILSENSPHWTLAYFGILATGATTVPILPDFRGKEILSIMEHAEASAVFVSSKLLGRLDEGLPASVELVVNLDNFQVLDVEDGRIILPEGSGDKLVKLEPAEDHFPGEETFFQAQADDLAAIIYTSGTTGRSKGVMLSHMNILSNGKQSASVHQVLDSDRFLSMLPLAHTYECTIGMVVPLLNGSSIHYIEKPPTAAYLTPLLRKIRPTTMLTVPLIIEKIYSAKIKPALYGKTTTRSLMAFGPTRRLLSRAAAKKLMTFFGGELRFFGVGGAPLSPDVERFLLDGGFPYAIGYGLTETSPMLAGFGPEDAIHRSVGKAMDGIHIRIDNPDPETGEGEIVAQGPNIMKGYYKEPDKTAEVFTEDGYFKTGDLGYIDQKGIIYIRGRLKNMILGPNGENIYPEEIEAVINNVDIVDESLVMEHKGQLIARVHLKMELFEERVRHLKENASELQQRLKEKQHMLKENAADLQHNLKESAAELQQQLKDNAAELQEKTDEILQEILVRVNTHVARNSKLQMVVLQADPFEKTPTHKIKRFLYQ